MRMLDSCAPIFHFVAMFGIGTWVHSSSKRRVAFKHWRTDAIILQIEHSRTQIRLADISKVGHGLMNLVARWEENEIGSQRQGYCYFSSRGSS